MKATKHHYPQIIQESEEFLSIFPSISYKEMESFFLKNYGIKGLDEKKMKNSLRMGFFSHNEFSNNLNYNS